MDVAFVLADLVPYCWPLESGSQAHAILVASYELQARGGVLPLWPNRGVQSV